MAYEVGALANIEETSEDDGKFTYNIYKTKSIDPTKDIDFGPFSLSDYYGSAIMPSLNWVTKIKTGEVVYDPADEQQDKLLKDYEAYIEKNGQIEGLPSPNEIMKQEMAPVLGQLAEGVGSSFVQGAGLKGGLPFVTSVMDATPSQTLFSDLTSASKAAKAGLTDQFEKLAEEGMRSGVIDTSKIPEGIDAAKLGGQTGINVMEGASFGDLINPGTDAGFQNLKGAAGGAVGNFAVQLALGRDPVKAAKSAGAGAIGKFIGGAFGPVGAFIGGALGSIVGGRVICNELHNQGLITKKQLVNDYKFTRDYLTPAHVNGYHLWALWMVKQMRKGRFVSFWKHIVLHRANEISYIYGESEKPDYLGKVYRRIFEPTCWILGLFCKETDWSVLYKQKEI